MSRVARFRKSRENPRKVIKKGKVTYSNRFSDKPSVESMNNNRAFIANPDTDIKTSISNSDLRCFEDWDLDNDGKINSEDVEKFIELGFFSHAQTLKKMLLTKSLPKKCYGRENIVTDRARSIERKIMMNKTKKFESVHRTHKNLVNLKKRNENRRNKA